MGQAPRGKIILVRHGETEANRRRCFAESDDIPLTAEGRAQAQELALLLSRTFQPHAIVSSEFRRALETSEIIAAVLKLAPLAVAGLHERNFGCLKGHPYGRLGEMMSGEIETWMWRPVGGESLDDVRIRAVEAIESLRVRYAGREIVVVCHGAVIQAVCAHVTGEWSQASVPPNCGIVTIAYDVNGWGRPVVSGEWDLITP